MATHSSILAWRILWTEKPGRLQSMWLHRVTHDYVINPHTHINISFVLYIYIFQILIPYKLYKIWNLVPCAIQQVLAGYLIYIQQYVYGEGNGTPLQYSCLENPMDGGAWCATVHGVAKSRTQLSNLTFTFHFHALEKEMATHSSVLAWRIPGTEEPDGLPSMGSHRVGHD